MAAEGMLAHIDPRCPVLILKMSGTPVHHGAVGVARTLGRRGVRVYAVVEDAYTPLAMSRYVSKAFISDRVPADSKAFVKAMAHIAESIGRLGIVIIPMDDLAAVSIAENANDLAQWFLIPPVAPNIPRKLADKASLYSLCNEIGVPTARSLFPRSFDEVRAFAECTQFPVVVKAAEQWLPIGSAFCTKVMETRKQLSDLCERYDYRGKTRFLIQEHIPGEDWIAHGYYNSVKNIRLTFTGRKLCAYPSEAGSTAVGLSVDNVQLRHESERLLESVAYSGIVDMDWRRDARDGQYRLLDCNPRIGQNFRIFENSEGIDVALAQYLDLSQQFVKETPSIEGRLFTVESFYALALLRRFILGGSEQNRTVKSHYHVREFAWWSMDDPVPFFVMVLRVVIRTISRTLARRTWWSLFSARKANAVSSRSPTSVSNSSAA
jgi:D-aspartate ligase